MVFFRCVVCAKHIDNHECFWKETHSISIGIHNISVLGSKRYISYSDTWHSLLPHWWNCHSDVRLWVYCDVINILSVLESTGILFTMAIVRHTTQYSDVSILKSNYFMYNTCISIVLELNILKYPNLMCKYIKILYFCRPTWT